MSPFGFTPNDPDDNSNEENNSGNEFDLNKLNEYLINKLIIVLESDNQTKISIN